MGSPKREGIDKQRGFVGAADDGPANIRKYTEGKLESTDWQCCPVR